MAYSAEQKENARILYLKGNTVPEIEKQTGIERRTLYLWSKSNDWNAAACPDDTFISIKRRIALLVEREKKSALELEELDRLIGHLVKLENLKAKHAAAAEAEKAGEGKDGHKKRGPKPKKNDFSEIDEEELLNRFRDGLFDYQLEMWDKRRKRNRNILKSRQIGFTYYFAREAFVDALLTGRNKIFLSASRAQADVFREYIRAAAREYFDGVEMVGKDTIELITPHGVATLYFLSTNSATAQSYHGDVYIDEYFWIPKFDQLKKVASAMASQKQWTRTYFSTPSVKSHPAYKFWSGDDYNERLKRKNKPVENFPAYDDLRKQGCDCPDGMWRIIITLDDSEQKGCNLFDRKQLELEYTEDEFDQLFLCKFPDDAGGCFRFAELERCLSDASEWEFFHPDEPKPYKGPVWIGYDPSRSRDGACIVVLSVPTVFKGTFHVLEKITLRNVPWETQAEEIKNICRKYDVDYIGIDTTGPGSGVYESVCRFFPAATPIFYTMDQKTKLVLKAQQIIRDNRILWDSNYSDIAAGFLLIRRTSTQTNGITYVADRSDLTGHADAAWAIMHALVHEDLVIEEDDGCCVV